MRDDTQAQARTVLTIPAPRNGSFYKSGELAEIMQRKPSAVHSWISRGIQAGGKKIKLQTLKAPKGCIPIDSVKKFFRQVNNVEVRIDPAPNVGRDGS